MLPDKALTVLLNLKRELLSRDVPEPKQEEKKEPERKGPTMRHARHHGEGFQRYCRQKNW